MFDDYGMLNVALFDLFTLLFLSQKPFIRDHGEPYSNRGFRLWSI